MKSNDDHIFSKLPTRLVKRLMSFQKDGVKFAVSKHGRCLIADEMGLGKTIQAISVAYYYRTEWPLLIIVPSSIRFCWIEELEKWLPDIQPCDINLIRGGNHASEISSAQITVVTYGLLSKQTSSIVKEALNSQEFKVVICDESHYIRNTRTASYKAVVPLIKNACRRILLSGTPALSRPVELFGQIDALKPGGFGTWWQFTSRYCDARYEWIGRQKMRKVDGASNLEELQRRLSSSVMIRREKQDVLKELPPKQRQKVLFELKDSTLKKDILKMFDELKPTLQKTVTVTSLSLDAANQETENLNGESLHRLSLISKLYKLSGEAKIGPVKEYLEMLCENTSLKFLVFAYHHVMMNGIQQTLYDKKVKFIRIDGATKPEDRMLYIQQFQSDPDTKVAILSILAAGVGLTFTAAKLVVFAELYWTPGVMLQCEDRAHRIGQTASLPVHYLVAKGTMDEWVWSTVCKKTIVTSTALTGKGRQLDADKGDKYQVDILSGADAWIPSEETDMDLQTFFQSQKDSDQRSILDFFTPPSKRKNRIKPSTTCRMRGSHLATIIQSDHKKQKTESSSSEKSHSIILEEIVVIDSDEEAEQFKEGKRRRKDKRSRKNGDDTDVVLIESNACDITCSGQTSPVRTPKSKNNSRTGKPESRTESEQWCCTACTFLNISFLPRCEMCNTPSKKTSTVTSPSGSTSESKSRKDQRKTNVKLAEIVAIDAEVDIHSPYEEVPEQSSDCVENNVVSTNNCQPFHQKYNNHEIESIPVCEEMPQDLHPENKLSQSKVNTYRILEHSKPATSDEEDCGQTDFNTKKRKCFSFDTHESSSILEKVPEERSSSSPPQRLWSGEEVKDSSSEEDLLGLTTVTARSKKRRKCFEFDSDVPRMSNAGSAATTTSEGSSSVQCPGSQDRRGIMSTPGRVESTPGRVESTPGSVESTPGRVESTPGRVESTPGRVVSTPGRVESTPGRVVSTPGRVESTPGRDVALGSLTWDLSPCSSPCFKLELESSGDKDPSLEDIANLEDQSLEREENRSLSPSASVVHSSGSVASPSGSTVCPIRSVTSPSGSVTSPSGSIASPSGSVAHSNGSVTSPSHSVSSINSPAKSSVASQLFDDLNDLEDDLPDLPLPRRRCRSANKETSEKSVEKTTTRKKPESPEMSVQSTGSHPRTTHTASQRETVSSEGRPSKEGCDPGSSRSTTSVQESERSKDPPYTAVKRTSSNGSPDSHVAFSMFLYTVSPYTGRVYLSDQAGEPLNENFLPLDVEMGNMDELPPVLHHHGNLRLVQKFVREWNSLSETKKRLIVKHGMLFNSPLATYDDVRSGKTVNTQRHRTKDDAAAIARKTAGDMNGTVRLISKRGQTGSQESHDQETQDGRGVLQAVTSDGVPLCLSCQQPYRNSLLTKSTITNTDNAWNTRFCSAQCMDKYWIQTHSGYCREKVYEVEHGVCQMCKVNAHSFYRQLKDTKELDKRAKLLSDSKFAGLKAKLKETMVRKPVEGQFWHVDHITPVWEGGGMCDIDNMRTLCVVCHHKVTAGQARKRAVVRRLQGASAGADITAFFQKS